MSRNPMTAVLRGLQNQLSAGPRIIAWSIVSALAATALPAPVQTLADQPANGEPLPSTRKAVEPLEQENAPDPRADEEATQMEKQRDVILRAMLDELDRNRRSLELENLADPYFIEFVLDDAVHASVSASLGAVTDRSENRFRALQIQIRVGSYELDNTNYRGGGQRRGWGGVRVPVDDDYNAIRQAIWWATDRDYKQVAETYAQKLAFMKTKVIEDKPDDFSRASPVTHFDPPAELSIDAAKLDALAIRLSQVFRNYAAVKNSQVNVQAGGENRYLTNTEGTRLRTADFLYAVRVTASVQADDGMEFSDALSAYGRTFEDLPPAEELVKRTNDMVQRLVAVRDAPKLDAYTGPVLFDAEPAAMLFDAYFEERFHGGQRDVGSGTPPDDFSKKLGRRILPRFMDVVDDPTQPTIHEKLALGNYTYDDEGIPARPVTLVEGGRLQTLLTSRNPSREIQASNGHGRGNGVSIGCLIVTARDGADSEALKQELIEACQDEGLEFGIRIASFGRADPSHPLVVYKVLPDGREELVRGAEMGRIDIKAFKRMLAAGDSPYVMNNLSRTPTTVVAPAMLFEELDLAKIDRDFDKPPMLPSPVARGG